MDGLHPVRITPARRRGLSLIEIMVVFAVIGVLLTLLLPAVQQINAASLRMQCRGHLRAFGIAIHSYQEAHGSFSAGTQSFVSVHLRVLPQIGLESIYNEINFDRWSVGDTNTTALSRRIARFLCPWNPMPSDGAGLGPTSYAVNNGSGDWPSGSNTGAFIHEPLSSAAFLDGLGKTAFMSEWAMPDRVAAVGLIHHLPSVPSDYQQFVTACLTAPYSADDGFIGNAWSHGSFGSTVYNHQFTPNRRSCSADGFPLNRLAFTASSRHGGGVNVLMGDGAVHWADESIDLRVWKAISTRAGGEVE